MIMTTNPSASIVSNNLINTIVEFALYDIPVGIKQERIVVYELRTSY